MEEAEMDHVYGLPYTRQPHPSYGNQPIPALQVVRHSIQIMRGCFGGCTFCSITAHEGRVIQSRSERSILEEIRRLSEDPTFTGVISDVGGPTANMYRMNCTRPEIRAKCKRLSCVHPTICKLLNTDHDPLIRLLKDSQKQPGIKKVFVASGVRTDLAQRSGAYLDQMVRHHVGGHLKVAPEHADPGVLELMKKPPIENYQSFVERFQQASCDADKQQYLVPYFIAGHPGSDLKAMIDVALYLKRSGQRPEQVQDFIPGPFDVATCMYHTGIDPMTGREIYVAKGMRERRLQRALLQFFKPENDALVREALREAGRADLIGSGPECLIPANPPKQSKKLPPRKKRSQESTGTAHGYRPHRKTTRKRSR
jgi:uncharacterized radical SAM protein YgiQ